MDKDKKYLSYSSYSTYQQCAYKYDLEKNQRIVPEWTPLHLILGSAFDQSANAILEGIGDPVSVGIMQLARLFFEPVEFGSKDYEPHLIGANEEKLLLKDLKKTGWNGNDYKFLATKLLDKMSNGKKLSKGQEDAILTIIFYCCLAKIRLMIKGFQNHIVPKIDKVISVQKKVKRGIIDFEVIFKGVKGVVIADNKTTSWPYEDDSVLYSVQLAGYGALVGSYIVFHKKVKKGAKEIVPQLIISKVPEHNRNMVEEAYENTEKLITAGIFPRNLNACGRQFGKPCVYIDLCWHSSMKGLVKKHETK
jgi:hypothetical protein